MSNAITTGVAQLLPAEVRQRLIDASAIEDPQEKNRAVEEAIRRARLMYPKYFKEEQES